MDPVSIFNALYDTKCLKFGHYDIKSGAVAPYYMNLHRLPLYPKLMEAVASQIYEKFLSPRALPIIISQLRRRRDNRSTSTNSQIVASVNQELEEALVKSEKGKKGGKTKRPNQSISIGSDSDSQLGEEDAASTETSSEDRDWEELSDEDEARPNIIISGVSCGAVTVAANIAFYAKIPFLFERKEAKGYGDNQVLIDDFETDSVLGPLDHKAKQQPTVILIEDVICSGESILETVRNLEKQNLKVEFVICIVDREANGINLLFKQAGIRVLSLYKISAILRVLEATGRIHSEKFRSIQQWIVNNQFKTIDMNPAAKSESPVATETIEGSLHVQVAAN